MRSLTVTALTAFGSAVIAALLVIAFLRGTPTAAPAPTDEDPTIRIEFTVMDAATGAPIDATIYLNDQVVGTGSELHVLVPAGEEQAIRAEAPGYQPFTVNMRPHGIDDDKRLQAPIRMRRARPGT